MSHVKSFKGFNNAVTKSTKKIEEEAGAMLVQVPEEFKAEKTSLDQEMQTIANEKVNLATREANLNKKYADLQTRIAAKPGNQPATATQPPAAPTA
jgi:FtsZ-binding cell division protein ZapB